MRKTLLVLASIALAVLLASGVAYAASIKGTEGDDWDPPLEGTNSRDVINPFAGNDLVYAYGGNDTVLHSYGNDTIYGGKGADTLRGGFDSDIIYGGPGVDLIDCAYVEERAKGEDYDIAYASPGDTVVDCETTNWTDPTDPPPS